MTLTLFPRNRSGVLLVENIIFLILNILFISILMLFLFRQGSGAIVLEQSYAKNIALLIDSSKPVTEMILNMKEGFVLAEKNGLQREDIVKIDSDRNIVTVRLSEKGGYEYSFFNDVDVTAYPDIFPENNYVIKINGYR
ncbi:MAG: hypothetical protein M1416_00450 [Candidatus Pacearchaeota archaeon]|nr:hypothetical protein [Candidatus Pacearchaeota archaeon]